MFAPILLPGFTGDYPFSFVYDEKPIASIINTWKREESVVRHDKVTETIIAWIDPSTGLKIEYVSRQFTDFAAVEWVLWFENTGKATTPVIENIQALDIVIRAPMSEAIPYRLHHTNGAPTDPTDFRVSTITINEQNSVNMSGGGGRSSNKDFPFFKIETAQGSYIIAVGWSGQWHSEISSPDGKSLHITAGLEKTHFVLYPGERVRSPRVLVFHWAGDTLESNSQFRQLIYKHYARMRDGKPPLPILFCNTAFTRGGGWLNECNAENQISLIKAYAPLGIEALITDAGWFEGGWPAGAGNWNVRKDAYPDGMGPVAKAAKEHGMVYGLWFEPERVVAGTEIHTKHPEWCLASQQFPQQTYLLNFGLPEVQNYFFEIVKKFMELPGFRFYRQDFNMDLLPHWVFSDASDRQGVTEMKYIEGLYAYWDRIMHTWPDAIMEECASGGRRIDLETIIRFHTHQESDYWFDNELDQNQIFGLSQYLPNNLFNTPLIRLDDYSFHSTMACSLIPGWIADDPDFDSERAKKLLDRYRSVRHLLVGAWYPLLPQSHTLRDWMAMQWHRPDTNEGLILVFRRGESPYQVAEVALRGLSDGETYELTFDSSGEKRKVKGSELMTKLLIELLEKPSSELILYRAVKAK